MTTVVLAAACGGAEDEEEVTAEALDQGGSTSAAPTTEAAGSDTSMAGQPSSTTTDSLEARPLFPVESCVEPVDAGTMEFSILVEDQERPVDIEWTAASQSTPTPGLMVALHGGGPGLESEVAIGDKSAWEAVLGPLVFVKPQASADDVRFWAESDTFDVTYMETLWDVVSRGLCFNPDRITLLGLRQGNTVATQTICSTDLPISVAVLQFGLNKPLECQPSRPGPIVSLNVLEPSTNGGGSWHEKWTPRSPFHSRADRRDRPGPRRPGRMGRGVLLHGPAQRRSIR